MTTCKECIHNGICFYQVNTPNITKCPHFAGGHTIRPVTLRASIGVPYEYMRKVSDANRCTKEELVFKLAKELIDSGVCDIRRADNERFQCATFEANVMVIPPKSTEVNDNGREQN